LLCLRNGGGGSARIVPDKIHGDKVGTGGLQRRTVASAVMQGETIALFGDYDVDGATSSALLSRFLESVGQRPRIEDVARFDPPAPGGPDTEPHLAIE